MLFAFTSDYVLWTIIVLYVGFIFTKGVRKSKKINVSDDYLLAGRNIGWVVMICTLGATVIGGGASVGATGKTYSWGLLMLFASLGWYLHFIFSGLVVAPKFREVRLYTVAGYFGHRFGEKPRFLALILSLFFSLFILAAQMAAFGTVLSAVLPDFADSQQILTWAIIIGGALSVIYSTAGGLLAVVHTDVYQFVVLLAGFTITLILCIPDVMQHWGNIREFVPPDFFTPDGGKGWIYLITLFLAFFLGETFSPAYATRFCSGKNIRETKMGIAGTGIFLAVIFPVILFFIAIYARIYHPEIEAREVLPMVVKQLNHPIVGGLIVAALLSAVMSSADSALNSATTIFVKDIFEHHLGWKSEKDAKKLKLARLCSALIGIGAILIAVLLPDIIGLLLITYHVWAPAIILPVTIGALSKKKSDSLSATIFLTMIIATVATVVYRFFPISQQFDPAVFGVLVSVVVYYFLTFINRIYPDHISNV